MDIAVPAVLVTTATVIVAFIVNQALAWAGVEVSSVMKRGIVFVAAVGLTGYYGYQAGFPLPDPADPVAFATALLASATAVFKASQAVYDKIWQGLLKA